MLKIGLDRFGGRKMRISAGMGGVAAGMSCMVPDAHAIPSPELVIGSISSLSQLVTLVAAMFGGSALAIGARAGLRGKGDAAGRGLRYAAGALLVLCTILGGLNVHQYLRHRDATEARLQSTLVRPAEQVGSRSLDPDLKQISLREQEQHRLGISTRQAAAELANKETVLLDIRETGEYQMGSLPGARHVRFPDLATSGIDFYGKKAILLCHNGNRSFETCERLAKLGIDCKFIRGGIEKWIVEGRAFTNPKVRTLSDLRAIPDYPGSSRLLDTADAHQFVQSRKATIVDVRYPGEFAVSHLPGAVNIPIRALPTAKLAALVSGLPQAPVIAACYDRRSCFSSQVLGLELSRAGYEFLGRYTLPWEYFEAKPVKPHIAAWLAAQNRGPWQRAIDVIAGWLSAVAGKVGLVLAIFIAAVCSRLLVLPISIKAERDQISLRENAEQLKHLKSSLQHDPARMARALKAFYQQHGLTPMRNLLALVFLPVMAVMLSAAEKAAGSSDTALLWIASLALPDRLFIIPLVFGILAGVYLDLAFVKTRRQQLFVWLAGAPLLAAIGATLSAAGGLYLIASIILLLMQRSFVTKRPAYLFDLTGRLRAAWQASRSRDGIVPLSFTTQLGGCGNKAVRLADLKQRGVPVPDGYVLTSRFIETLDRHSEEGRQRVLARLAGRMGGQKVAVRSSASGEDGNQHSFAGVFDSVLNVTPQGFCAAVETVMSSFNSERCASYGIVCGAGNILVQRMVEAEFSGVLFTRDPAGPGAMLVELVEGTADKLVSGSATPQVLRFGRNSHELLDGGEAPVDLAELLRIGARCEAIFQAPQDIEWAFADGRFMIVQTRDITATVSEAGRVVGNEWQRLMDLCGPGEGSQTVLQQDAMSEVLPQPTPYSLSFMEKLWASGGSVDLACRRLGLCYRVQETSPSHLVTAFGRLYTDPRVEQANAVRIPALAAKRLRTSAKRIADDFENGFLPRFVDEVAVLEAADFTKLRTPKLIKLAEKIREDFTRNTHVEVETINIAAQFYLDRAQRLLTAAGLPPAQLLSLDTETAAVSAIRRAMVLPEDQRGNALVAVAGHRSAFDYELSAPRYKEDPDGLAAYCSAFASHPCSVQPGGPANVCRSGLDPAITLAVDTAKRYQLLKEMAKDQSLRQLAVLRSVLLAIDERLGLAGGIFFLRAEEVTGLATADGDDLKRSIECRKAEREVLLATPPMGASLKRYEVEAATLPERAEKQSIPGRIAGNRVAGSGTVFGRARVVDAAACEAGGAIEDFRAGDILVCKMIHPAWLAYVLKAGGVVCEVGGWLSHMAIVARENNIAMITGACGADAIEDGAALRLLASGQVDILETNSQSVDDAKIAMTG